MNYIGQEIIFLMVMALLLFCSAFFSGSETALFSLSSETLRQLREKGRTAGIIRILEKEPSELLASILFGNLIVNILFFCAGAAASGRWAESRGEWFEAIGGIVVLVTLILFGEITPKALGVNHSSAVLRWTAVPLQMWFNFTRFSRYLIRKLLSALNLKEEMTVRDSGLTRGELKELLDAVRHEPGFGSQEKEILEDIVNLSDVRVREVMVPRVRVLRKPLDADRQQVLEEARVGEYSHVILYRESDDDPLGYICTRELFFNQAESGSLESLIHPLVFVPETKRVDILVQEFMTEGWTLAAVVDEYGGLAGLVTLEDLFEEVVGDFEPQKSSEIVKLDAATYRVQGQIPIRAWRDLFTGFLPGQEVETLAFDTLGGLIISLLGRMPKVGDSVTVRNLRMTVEAMHHRRVDTVLLHLQEGGAA
ncbi:MAG: HlyC/CorC family transporter [Kiritimatiellales bacterium]|nr:HlyC/CorC family transporter [Kiritimatiellota bacterium]MBL7011863.1 HlyC/CorC family transporter [Kiritimatiellales bacterium]